MIKVETNRINVDNDLDFISPVILLRSLKQEQRKTDLPMSFFHSFKWYMTRLTQPMNIFTNKNKNKF